MARVPIVIETAEVVELQKQIHSLYDIVAAQHLLITIERRKFYNLNISYYGDQTSERVTHDEEELQL